ncbi:hypothetical protein NVP1069O_16 [Vibrio phage 1.069.O._10N.286.49.F11]|uniref:Uncharacterized protein n=7 Tax=Autolykiviridae TaxID=2184034 RepID=A0A2I7S845_9VIRU|nr:hypothetical protein KMD65_gp15 [Vibrio phage 1.008.O._10N.286.54.E5]AUR81644.1 hypothetical protein NVP1011O_15 [Vibrio phage 1.011.O._10N.286.49.B11]AUR83783.1 hypothetical protein NVP1040O_16 [Vibrio phage 1.040.O._10N.286.45.B9]AUR84662.1 hypothetical protein NVP1062O_16 [Vibrio phage 1.062.O._10N.286.55.C3]AUR85159.1 hypothetical protein NVP1069O_16 [Vibrio phage 1.069.O._10N.286.49.F11]AUR89587.1 hypothetical protein NVP1125O_16 [Vibrio phage 1.125.O._10N.286.49.F5]AUS02076.1 hypothe
MNKFEPVPIDEILEAMPKSIHRHTDLVKRQLKAQHQYGYKFRGLYIIFEPWDDTLMVQCVEGTGLDEDFVKALYKCAINNGFEYIQFVTPHKGLHKMVKSLKPERIEFRYICKLDEVEL